jgi:hypothetical protein
MDEVSEVRVRGKSGCRAYSDTEQLEGTSEADLDVAVEQGARELEEVEAHPRGGRQRGRVAEAKNGRLHLERKHDQRIGVRLHLRRAGTRARAYACCRWSMEEDKSSR